jgi:hypothetical protein
MNITSREEPEDLGDKILEIFFSINIFFYFFLKIYIITKVFLKKFPAKGGALVHRIEKNKNKKSREV